MKILVPTKRVPDTDQRIHVREDGRGIDDAMLPFVVNPFDAIAVEEALRIREAASQQVEVVVVGIGGEEYEKQLRTGLAMGADRAVHVVVQEALDPWNVAQVLVAVTQRETPNLVLMGKQAVDDDSNQVGQFVAARLGWPQATFASRIELVEQRLRVARETDAGLETISVSLPAVVTADLRLNEPRYASLPSIMKARRKPLERLPVAELPVTIERRLEVVSFRAVQSSRTCRRVADADELLDCLRDEAKVL